MQGVSKGFSPRTIWPFGIEAIGGGGKQFSSTGAWRFVFSSRVHRNHNSPDRLEGNPRGNRVRGIRDLSGEVSGAQGYL